MPGMPVVCCTPRVPMVVFEPRGPMEIEPLRLPRLSRMPGATFSDLLKRNGMAVPYLMTIGLRRVRLLAVMMSWPLPGFVVEPIFQFQVHSPFLSATFAPRPLAVETVPEGVR